MTAVQHVRKETIVITGPFDGEQSGMDWCHAARVRTIDAEVSRHGEPIYGAMGTHQMRVIVYASLTWQR